MYAIALFGVLMMILSVMMVINPYAWSNGMVKFSLKPYFHPFEIASRIGFGVIFLLYAHQTLYPMLMTIIGYLLVAVGIGLLFMSPSKHKHFAVWLAKKFINIFRAAGLVSFLFGGFLVYAALKG